MILSSTPLLSLYAEEVAPGDRLPVELPDVLEILGVGDVWNERPAGAYAAEDVTLILKAQGYRLTAGE